MNEDYIPVTDIHVLALNGLCNIINSWATKKGWNQDVLKGLEIPEDIKARIEHAFKAEQIALIHSETSECLEFTRKLEQPAMDDHVPSLTGEAAELADVLIRIFHYCGKRNINLGEAVKLKHQYNTTRPYRHGKLN